MIVQGETGSGGKILQMFQESPLLKDPVFKATMTRVAPNAERFHISGELVAADMPKSLLLSDPSAVMTVSGGLLVPVAPAAPAGAPSSAKATPAAATTQPTVAVPGTTVSPAAVSGAAAASTDASRKGAVSTTTPPASPAATGGGANGAVPSATPEKRP